MGSSTFFSLPCLDSVTTSDWTVLKKTYFKGVGRAPKEHYLNRLISINQDQLKFLNVEAQVVVDGHNAKIRFTSHEFIGMVPLKSPIHGKYFADLVVTPKYATDNQNRWDMLHLDGVQFEPEYQPKWNLFSPPILATPQYLKALDYLHALNELLQPTWQKLISYAAIADSPKGNVDWNDYARNSYKPESTMRFKTSINGLHSNHREIQELKYVYQLCKEILDKPVVPHFLKSKAANLEHILRSKLQGIDVRKVDSFVIRGSDNIRVKKCKEIANTILLAISSRTIAWRLDGAKVFEQFAQYLVAQACKGEVHGRLQKNPKISSSGTSKLSWTLRYLEPDFVLEIPRRFTASINTIQESGDPSYSIMHIAGDAKFKAHGITSGNVDSPKFKETFRADLHQILAYCAFMPSREKLGILIYPGSTFIARSISYKYGPTNTSIRVLILAVPLGKPTYANTIAQIKQELLNLLGQGNLEEE